MEYEGQICRSPMERSSFMLPIMVGCSYNGCKFCNLFRSLKYRELPVEQIEDELRRVKNVGGKPKKIFLGDGSAFDCKFERLSEILNLIRLYFPECKEINTDATVSGILKKTDDELYALHNLGVTHLYIGIESGLDDVLKFMRKDHNIYEAKMAIERIKTYGYFFDAHVMSGVAGKGGGCENARALSEFLNQTEPFRVVNFSMFIHNEVPLFQDIKKGLFLPADELENLKEEKELITLLEADSGKPIQYEGFHDFIAVRVRGRLPMDREKMLSTLEKHIQVYEQKASIYTVVNGKCALGDLKKDTGESVWYCK